MSPEAPVGALPEIRCLVGSEVRPHLDALAALRIEVFREWPYLYEGSADYEQRYLATYAASPRSLFVLAMVGSEVVGVSTAIPLVDESATFREPFVARGIDPSEICYFGESVLRREWRGRGLGHRFFDEREAHARRLGGFRMTAFCAVERATDDPRRPADHRELDAFWKGRGYRRDEDLACILDWPEAGDPAPRSHRLRFWLRPLEVA